MTEDIIRRLFASYTRNVTPEQATAYLDILSMHADDVLEDAVRRTREDSPTFPPTAPAIDAKARAILREREARTAPAVAPDHSALLAEPVVIPLPSGGRIAVTREYYHDCDMCDDSAWQEHWCPGGMHARSPKPWWDSQACGRRHAENDPGHEFATACPCAKTNPTIRRRNHPQRTAA